MARLDPGTTILWAKNPAYTVSLVAAIVSLPRDEADILFSSAKSKSGEWKAVKQAALDKVTQLVFTARGDHAREKKQRESVARRIVQLAKEYQDSLGELKQNPYEVQATLDELRNRYPHWDQFRGLLRDHPDMESWDELDDRLRESDGEEEAREVHGVEEEAMQDVYYPHQPIAGPSGHNNRLSNSWPNQNRAQDPLSPSPSRGLLGPQENPHILPFDPSLQQQRRGDLARGDGEAQHLREMLRRAEAAAAMRLHLFDRDEREGTDAELAIGDGGAGQLRGERVLVRRRSASPVPRRHGIIQTEHHLARGGGLPNDRGIGNVAPDEQGGEVRQDRRDLAGPEANDGQPRPLDDDVFASCPKCSIDLIDWSVSDSEAHLRACLDGGEGAHLEACPVCERPLNEPGWDRQRAEQHVDECCRALTGGGPGSGGERKNRRDHVVFVCGDKSVPRDDKTGEALECSFCLDDFAPDTSLARLSCYCIYHELCVKEYWQQPGDKFCPLHRDLDGVSEVEMQ